MEVRRNSMKKGFWTIICILILVFSKEGFADSIWVCSNCGQQVKAILGDVCPYCGAQKHIHSWSEATCTEPKTCTVCGATEGEALVRSADPSASNRQGSYEIGDIILFGHYEQDNDKSNGKEDIEWIVLDKKQEALFVISRYALDSKPFHNTWSDTPWSSCTLRSWLNGTFLGNAFSSREKAYIETAASDKDADSGTDIQDQVFLLSIAEAEKYLWQSAQRACKATTYAAAQGAFVNPDNGNCWWWLQSPGKVTKRAVCVNDEGAILYDGIEIDEKAAAVRPALWINPGS